MAFRTSIALAALTVALLGPAHADPRDVLRVCQGVVKRAAQAQQDANIARPDEAEIVRCRQVVRDWTLRDSRMLVDEDGKPLR